MYILYIHIIITHIFIHHILSIVMYIYNIYIYSYIFLHIFVRLDQLPNISRRWGLQEVTPRMAPGQKRGSRASLHRRLSVSQWCHCGWTVGAVGHLEIEWNTVPISSKKENDPSFSDSMGNPAIDFGDVYFFWCNINYIVGYCWLNMVKQC